MRRVLAVVGVLALVAVASAQELRAWMDLNFGDSPEVVQAKMEAMQDEGRVGPGGTWAGQQYSRIARNPTGSTYPVDMAGVDMRMRFDFYDNKLYRLRFTGPTYNASYFHTTVMDEAATLRQVLRNALGNPVQHHDIHFFDMSAGYVTWSDVWRSGGVTRYVGIGETSAQYYAHLRIQWDWMVNFIAEQEEKERDQSIQDASEGF